MHKETFIILNAENICAALYIEETVIHFVRIIWWIKVKKAGFIETAIFCYNLQVLAE